MSARTVVADVLLWAGVALELVSCLGLVVMRTALDRLHFCGPAALGAVFVAAAVLVQESFSLVGDKALLVAVFLVATGPLVTLATARVARLLDRGDWRPGADEATEVRER